MAFGLDDLVGGVVGAGIGFLIGGPAGAAVGFAAGAFGDELVSSLIQLPKPPQQIEDAGQVYSVQARQNVSRIGDTKIVQYGFTRYWPALIAQSWAEYIGNEHYRYMLMSLGVGHYDVQAAFLGDMPVTSLPGVQLEIYQPGERVTLFRPNVYTSAKVENIELMGGCTTTAAADGNDNSTILTDEVSVTFDASTGVITAPAGTFDEFLRGDIFQAFSSVANSGTMIAHAVAADGSYIITQSSIANETVTTRVGLVRRRYGPYPVCPPRETVTRIGWDFEFPQGLGFWDAADGEIQAQSITLAARYRPIDDSGIPTGNWVEVTWDVTRRTNTPVRISRYVGSADGLLEGRYEADACRVTRVPITNGVFDAVRWVGLKGFITDTNEARLYPDQTTIAIVLRASGATASRQDNTVNVFAQRLLPTYNGSDWSAPQATSSPVWAALDVLRSEYGFAAADDRIDLAAFLALQETVDVTGDEFNGTFDQETSAWDALTTILRVCRARPLRRNGIWTLIRDEPQTGGQLFTDRNIFDLSTEESLPDESSPTGVSVEYTDPVTWQPREIEVPSAGAGDRPMRVKLMGCTDRTQAWREGNFIWAEQQKRRLTFSFGAEMEAALLKYGGRAWLQHAEVTGQSGEVKSAAGLTINLRTPVTWSNGEQHYVRLRSPNGQSTDEIACSRGADDAQLVLATAHGIEIIDGESQEQQTLVAFGLHGKTAAEVLIRGVTFDSLWQGRISAVLEDQSVHADPGAPPPDASDTPWTAVNLSTSFTAIDIVGPITSTDRGLAVSWVDVSSATYYEIHYRASGTEAWTRGAVSVQPSARMTIPLDEIEIRLWVWGPAGRFWWSNPTSVAAGSSTGNALQVTVSTTSVGGSTTQSIYTTASVSANISGGTAPYSGIWVKTSGDDIAALTPGSASTGFQATSLIAGETRTAYFRYQATDGSATTANSAAVKVTISRLYSGGGNIP